MKKGISAWTTTERTARAGRTPAHVGRRRRLRARVAITRATNFDIAIERLGVCVATSVEM